MGLVLHNKNNTFEGVLLYLIIFFSTTVTSIFIIPFDERMSTYRQKRNHNLENARWGGKYVIHKKDTSMS